MGMDALHSRRQEVTRTVCLSCPASVQQNLSVTWSGPVEELFGFPLGDIGSTEDWWLGRVHPDDRAKIRDGINQHLVPAPKNPFAAESRICSYDYRFQKADGRYVLVSDRTIASRDELGNLVGLESIIFDKQKRQNEREAYRKSFESQDHLMLIANNTQSGIYMMDTQGYCIYMNPAAEQITGFKFHEIYDYTFHASCHSCYRNGDPYPIEKCPIFGHQQKGTAAKNQSEVFVHKDGHHYDIEFNVSPIGDYKTGGAVIEFRDVTEQKRIEQERLKAILITEQQSNQIKSDEIHKQNMTSFVSFVCHELRNPLQGISSSAEFLRDTLQKLDALTARLSLVETGTTPRKNMLVATETLTLSSTPNEGEHDFSDKNLRRRSIRSSDASIIVEMQSMVAYSKELVANIQICAEHQALITDNVLDLSRLDAGKVEASLEVVDVHALGQQTVDMMSARAKRKDIKLSMRESQSWPLHLMADPIIFRQVLLNLVSNAIKFTPEHGIITIDIYAEAPDQDGRVTLQSSVTDNGLGMTEAEQQNLFQRFSQANRRVAQLYGGSGLGLSISKELVRVMGGEMHVKSEQGKGSTFSFTSIHDQPTKDELVKFLRQSNFSKDGLPAVISPPTDSHITPQGAMGNAPPKFRMIAVAEDNPINRTHLARHLKMLGYEYTLCINGREILDKVCESESTIDCCLMDMSMPVMDGLEATRLIRQFESSVRRVPMPIIALSGNALREQVMDALSAGISDYLVKPCKQAEISRRLKYWEGIIHTHAEHKPMLDTYLKR